MDDSELIFGSHGLQLRRYGLAVLPIGPNRTPYVSGFNRWSKPPGERTVAKWCGKYPDADIALIPGLSGVIVVDSDDASQDGNIEELFGPTPLRVLTGRGRHRYYRRVKDRLPGNLRAFGLDCDLKTGSNLVIVPPSFHESGTRYRLDNCDWSALADLPPPDLEKLHRLIDKQRQKPIGAERQDMRDGSRNQWLNDRLCRHVMSCGCFEELLDVAGTLNDQLEGRGFEKLDEVTVLKHAENVWEDAQEGKLEHWVGREGVARICGSAINHLCRIDRKRGPDALTLLLRLQIEHAARCKRGETFTITPKAMARDGIIPGWERKRYARARDLLLVAGFIEKVAEFHYTWKGPSAAQYRLSQPLGAGAV